MFLKQATTWVRRPPRKGAAWEAEVWEAATAVTSPRPNQASIAEVCLHHK